MERGVIVGGLLIAVSFLCAVLLNRSAVEDPVPVVETETQAKPACPTERPPSTAARDSTDVRKDECREAVPHDAAGAPLPAR